MHNSEVTDPIRPELELVRDFMPVLVSNKFDEDPIKNEPASLETTFPHYKYGKFFRCLRAPNSTVSGPIWPKFDLFRDFMPVLVTCKFEKDLIKNKRKCGDIVFSIICQWVLSIAMETRVMIHSAPKPYAFPPSQ